MPSEIIGLVQPRLILMTETFVKLSEKNQPSGVPGLTSTGQLTVKSGTGGEAVRAEGESATHHALTAIQHKAGTGAAINVVSENTEFSAAEITGVENNKGSLKISHTNESGTAGGDSGAAMLSLETHNGTETGSACQGIALKASGANNTGRWITARNSSSTFVFGVTADARLELKETTFAAGTEASCVAIWAEGGALKCKFGAGSAKTITIT